MPYIKPEHRDCYDEEIKSIVEKLISLDDKQLLKGHHNYIMFKIAEDLSWFLGKRYATLQDIVGTFDCCKMEFYRRVVAPYEDKAKDKNGDVLPSNSFDFEE